MEFVDDEHFQFAELIGEETLKPFAYMLSKALKAGHICISLEQKELDAAVGEMAPDVRRRFVAPDVAALQRNRYWVAIDRAHRRPFIVANNKLYIARYFNYETNIMSCIKGFLAEEKKVFAERSAALNLLRSAVPKVEVLEGAAADSEEAVDWQMVAGVYGYVNNFTIVTGGPGTGKTTTVAKILNLLYADNPQCKVVLSAPTGKAAMRMKETLRANQNLDAAVQEKVAQMEPKTIHSLLGYIPDSPYFKYNSERFLEYDVVIVDEASMIAVALFSKLIAAVDPTKRLILLGDKNQLTSIEAGGLLGDLCNSVPAANRMAGNKKNLFGSLLGNADFIPAACVQEVGAALLTENIVELKRSRRFDDAQGIGQLSKAILQGDAETVQRIITVGAQTAFVEMDENYSPAFFKRFADQFKAYTQESDPLVALGLFNRVRVLCAVKEGRCGVYDVNKRIERHLSESKCIRMDGVNYHNKPVIVTKNYHKLNLFNGDIGLMRKDAEGNYRVYFMDGNNALRSVLPGLIPEVETVFAMTIHKSQGSEYEQVLVLLPDKHDHQMLSKELVYTAVTRGKAKVWIQGTSEILLQSLQRSVKRVSGVTERINQENI
jgi:exodeoxyribonuclease V alpha subunit